MVNAGDKQWNSIKNWNQFLFLFRNFLIPHVKAIAYSISFFSSLSILDYAIFKNNQSNQFYTCFMLFGYVYRPRCLFFFFFFSFGLQMGHLEFYSGSAFLCIMFKQCVAWNIQFRFHNLFFLSCFVRNELVLETPSHKETNLHSTRAFIALILLYVCFCFSLSLLVLPLLLRLTTQKCGNSKCKHTVCVVFLLFMSLFCWTKHTVSTVNWRKRPENGYAFTGNDNNNVTKPLRLSYEMRQTNID